MRPGEEKRLIMDCIRPSKKKAGESSRGAR
jgi:hypothetical protein